MTGRSGTKLRTMAIGLVAAACGAVALGAGSAAAAGGAAACTVDARQTGTARVNLDALMVRLERTGCLHGQTSRAAARPPQVNLDAYLRHRLWQAGHRAAR